MITLLKGFGIFVLATLGTTAVIGHAPRAVHPRPVAQAFNGTDAGAAVPERDLLHERTAAYVPPPVVPAPPPAEVSASEPAAEPGSAPAAPAPRYAAPLPPPAPVPVAPPPQPAIGSGQQALINADRAAAGLPPLSWSGCLAGVAAGQDAAMVAAGRIFHGAGVSQDFGCGLGSGQTGENVGYWSGGVNDAQLNVMFMNSPEHRANIMGPYRYVGTAWRVAPNGSGYIAVEFG